MTSIAFGVPYVDVFHEHAPPLAFDLIQAECDAALIRAMELAEIPANLRLRLVSKFNGQMLASALNPNCRNAQ